MWDAKPIWIGSLAPATLRGSGVATGGGMVASRSHDSPAPGPPNSMRPLDIDLNIGTAGLGLLPVHGHIADLQRFLIHPQRNNHPDDLENDEGHDRVQHDDEERG
jgi:hypothetical protein